MDKQRQIDEIPQGGIVNNSGMLSLGYCNLIKNDKPEYILNPTQIKQFEDLIKKLPEIMKNYDFSKINISFIPTKINQNIDSEKFSESVKNLTRYD
jgi:hypothetical protein